MKLIFIYGPPASGKLTVAEKLSSVTSIPVFHNHLSRDLVKDIYGDNLMSHYELVDQIRTDVLGYCARNNTDLIFTYVYEGIDDDKNVKDFIKEIEVNGGEVHFVELSANQDDLLDRVGNESRKKYKKLTDKSILKELTNSMEKFSIPYVESLKINTSETNPDESANLIIDKLNL